MVGLDTDRSRRGRQLVLLGYVFGVSILCSCQVYDSSAVGEAHGAHDTPVYAGWINDAAAPPLDETPSEERAANGDAGAPDETAADTSNCAASTECPAAHALAVCQAGVCRLAECLDGYRDCDGEAGNGCEIAPGDPDHCGACHRTCSDLPHASGQCEAGTCALLQCRDNFGDCNGEAGDGCETPLDTLGDCGACGVPCDLASCAGGVCSAVSCADEAAEGPCFDDAECSPESYDGRDYLFCASTRNWASARARCLVLDGGDLVNIGSGGENAFVSMRAAADAWIGANDVDDEGRWRWINNGQPFWRGAADGAPQSGRYANWRAGEPDEAGDGEDCAEIGVDGTWADAACSGLRPFVCEVDLSE